MASEPTPEPEIEFGAVQGRAAVRRLRPDRDGLYTVVPVGAPQSAELPIFVDLDVMRDMEAHANSNLDVELGGVLLGWQARDEAGQPFVQIVDSLRAEHYEATRGSFKFTHETWSEITRRRQQLHPELQLVGWYHTHPGWGVFLSEMDRFICEHFFAAAEDVALVIDPRQQTRGWFQWLKPGTTAQLHGWYLIAHRHRQRELDYYSRLYSGAPMPHFDPRYSEPPVSAPTTVQLVDRGNPQLNLITWLLLTAQTIALLLLAIRLLTLPVPPPAAAAADATAGKINQAVEATAGDLATARSEIYREVLAGFLQAEGQSPDLAKLFADSQLEKEQLAAANRSHTSRIAQLEQTLEQQAQRANRLTAEMKNLEAQMASMTAARTTLPAGQSSSSPQPIIPVSDSGRWEPSWVLPGLLGVLAVSLIALLASLLRGARLARDLARLGHPSRPRPPLEQAVPETAVPETAEREPVELPVRN